MENPAKITGCNTLLTCDFTFSNYGCVLYQAVDIYKLYINSVFFFHQPHNKTLELTVVTRIWKRPKQVHAGKPHHVDPTSDTENR